MSRLSILVVHFALAMLRDAQGLTADEGCQTVYDQFQMNTSGISYEPCETSTTTCPATCVAAMDDLEKACQGKNVEVEERDDAGNSVKNVVEFSEVWLGAGQRTNVVWWARILADDGCQQPLFDYAISKVANCRNAWDLASSEIATGEYCSESLNNVSCHSNCQAVVNKAHCTCKTGDQFGEDSDDTWNSNQAEVIMETQGPNTCSYQKDASACVGDEYVDASSNTVSGNIPASYEPSDSSVRHVDAVLSLVALVLPLALY